MADSFWNTFGPGLLEAGTEFLQNREGRKAQDKAARITKGPLYDQQVGLAGGAYRTAGNIDPRETADQEYQDWLKLTEQGRTADEQALMRRLVAQGQSGIASHGAVAGTAPTPGVPMNPQLAALYAAQEGAKERAAFDARNVAESRLTGQLNRAGMLSSQANEGLSSRSQPSVQRVIAPDRPSTFSQVLSAGSKLLSNPKIADAATGMLGTAFDKFSGLFGGSGGASAWDFSSPGWFGSSYGTDDDWMFDI